VVGAALAGLGQRVGEELGRVEAAEARLSSQLQRQVGCYRAGMATLQRARRLCSAGGRLAEVEGWMAEARRRAHDLVSGLDGAQQLAAVQAAIRAVGGELGVMDVRLGLLQRRAMMGSGRR
jgi:hypothetical protein